MIGKGLRDAIRTVRHDRLLATTLGCVAACALFFGGQRVLERSPLALYDASNRPESLLQGVTGRLELHGQCVVVVDASGESLLVAWPDPGTKWDSSSTPPRVGLGDTLASLGDLVTVSGTRLNGFGGGAFDWVESPSSQCADGPLLVAFAMIRGALQANPGGPAASDLPDASGDWDSATVRAYAAEFGVTLEEAFRRLELQGALDEPVARIRALAPGRFAGDWLQHEPTFTAVVAFTGGERISGADNIAAPWGESIEIRLGARYSLAQLLQGLALLGPSLTSDFPEMASSVDVREGAIRLSGPTDLTVAQLDNFEALAGIPIIFEKAGAEVPL